MIALDEAYRYALGGEDDRRTAAGAMSSASSRASMDEASPADVRGSTSRDFTLRRLRDHSAATSRGDRVVRTGGGVRRVHVAGGDGMAAAVTHIFQLYEGAGYRTPIHRTIAVPRYDVNSADFEARACRGARIGQRDDAGDAGGTSVPVRQEKQRRTLRSRPRGGHSIRSIIGGVFVDPNISRPLAFAGLSYIDLNLFGRGAQVNVFFGGVYGQASWSVPSIAGTRWQAHGQAFGIAAQYSDRVFRNGREQYAENLRQQPGYVSVGTPSAADAARSRHAWTTRWMSLRSREDRQHARAV